MEWEHAPVSNWNPSSVSPNLLNGAQWPPWPGPRTQGTPGLASEMGWTDASATLAATGTQACRVYMLGSA